MINYIITRLIQAVIILIIVTLIIFFAMRMLPGDPILMLVTQEQEQEFTQEEVNLLRHKYGLDKPIVVQYYDWISNLVQGDLGRSILTQAPVTKEIVRRVPITLHIGLLAFIVGIVLGIPAGVICAVRRGGWLDTVVTTIANLGITLPSFWLGVLLMYLFGLHLQWLPIMGYTSPFEDFWLSTRQIIMPVICLAIFPIAGTARQTRSSMLEVMRQDYIRTAWSKGFRERWVIMRHALKNGLIPVVTLSGMHLSQILGGSVLIETVFVVPGMGLLLVFAVTNQDYPYVQGVVLVIAVAVILANLLVDIAYGWLDPRIRFA